MDSVVVIGVTLGVLYPTGSIEIIGKGQLGGDYYSLVLGGALFAAFLIANGYLLIQHGQTLGKRLFDIKIVSAKSRNKAPFWRIAILRYLPFFLVSASPWGALAIPLDVAFVLRADRRCLHDLLSGTAVTYARFGPQSKPKVP